MFVGKLVMDNFIQFYYEHREIETKEYSNN